MFYLTELYFGPKSIPDSECCKLDLVSRLTGSIEAQKAKVELCKSFGEKSILLLKNFL